MERFDKNIRILICFVIAPILILIYIYSGDWFGGFRVRGRFESNFVLGALGVILFAAGLIDVLRKK